MVATLFRTSELARWCNVDIKTIHNWVERGLLPAGRTPGNHLRFKPADVKALLERMGAPVPDIVRRACDAVGGPQERVLGET